jgi:hypothetical protein
MNTKLRAAARGLALAIVFALGACNRPPSSEGLEQDEQPTLENASAVAAPRLYDPMSKTAEAFTGSLEFTDLPQVGPNEAPKIKIIAGLGHVWEISWVGQQAASEAIGGQQWLSFLPAAEGAQVNIYSVDAESINAQAPNGGLCAPDATGFMAFTEAPNATGDTQLTIAAFKDKAWPPQNGRPAQLCGTFSYTLNRPEAPSETP